MRKTYQVNGYGTNKRGHTVGIRYTLTATSESKAREMAQRIADAGGYKHVSILRVTTVSEVEQQIQDIAHHLNNISPEK